MPPLPRSPSGQQASPLSLPRRAALGSSAHSSLSRQIRPNGSSRSSHSWTALTARGKSLKAACASKSSPAKRAAAQTLPGVGDITATVAGGEVGSIASVGRKSRWTRRNHQQGRCRPGPEAQARAGATHVDRRAAGRDNAGRIRYAFGTGRGEQQDHTGCRDGLSSGPTNGTACAGPRIRQERPPRPAALRRRR
jgi:hypothetical protein